MRKEAVTCRKRLRTTLTTDCWAADHPHVAGSLQAMDYFQTAAECLAAGSFQSKHCRTLGNSDSYKQGSSRTHHLIASSCSTDSDLCTPAWALGFAVHWLLAPHSVSCQIRHQRRCHPAPCKSKESAYHCRQAAQFLADKSSGRLPMCASSQSKRSLPRSTWIDGCNLIPRRRCTKKTPQSRATTQLS